MDWTLFRSEYDEATLLAAPSLELHPALRRLPNLAITVYDTFDEMVRRIGEQTLHENATRPACATICFDSSDDHECQDGPQSNCRDTMGQHVDASVPKREECIVDHKADGNGKPVKVADFVKGFLASFAYRCDEYSGSDEASNPFIFDGWQRQRIDSESRSGWSEWPDWQKE